MVSRRLVPLLGIALTLTAAVGTAGPATAAERPADKASQAPQDGAPPAQRADDAPEDEQRPLTEAEKEAAEEEARRKAEEAAERAGAEAAAKAAKARLDEATRQVEALRDEVTRVAVELTAGTLELEEGQAHLEDVQERARAARAAADAALAEVRTARTRLTVVIGASYRVPRPSDMSLAFAAAPGELSAAVLASAELDHVHGNAALLLREATAKDAEAKALVAEAERLEAEAVARTADLEAQVTALRTTAQDTLGRLEAAAAVMRQAELDAEAARIALLDEKARKKALAAAQERVLTDVSGGLALCLTTSTRGYVNGFLPPEALCPLSIGNGHRLRADAAKAFNRMARERDLCVTDSYRSYGAQVDVYGRKPDLAAVPGTSNHGLGLALDLCGGVESFGTEAYRWMKANAPRYGWAHPSWAEPGGSRPEPWHWEYVGVTVQDGED